jgi:hypothetical protein
MAFAARGGHEGCRKIRLLRVVQVHASAVHWRPTCLSVCGPMGRERVARRRATRGCGLPPPASRCSVTAPDPSQARGAGVCRAV